MYWCKRWWNSSCRFSKRFYSISIPSTKWKFREKSLNKTKVNTVCPSRRISLPCRTNWRFSRKSVIKSCYSVNITERHGFRIKRRLNIKKRSRISTAQHCPRVESLGRVIKTKVSWGAQNSEGIFCKCKQWWRRETVGEFFWWYNSPRRPRNPIKTH